MLEFNLKVWYIILVKRITDNNDNFQAVSQRISSGEVSKDMKFSDNLVKYRKKAGITQSQLAARLSVTPQAVSKWENGSYPDSELLPEISRILDVSLDVLFGLKEDDGKLDISRVAAQKLQNLPEEEKSAFVIQLGYALISAYNLSAAPEAIKFPETLNKETYAMLRTDHELALERLNQDMQYLCFMRIPENGIDSYFHIDDRIIRLFSLLSDENTLRIIKYCETLGRNCIITKDFLASELSLPPETVDDIVTRSCQFGLMWELTANTGAAPFPIYGYVHHVAIAGILTLAESVVNYLSFCEPNIDIWLKPPFRGDKPESEMK